jgi:hypothetical protein
MLLTGLDKADKIKAMVVDDLMNDVLCLLVI